MPVAHALLQSKHDLREATADLTPEQLAQRLNGAASLAFHLRHIAGSTDRLLTYARGGELTTQQREDLAAEKAETIRPMSAQELLHLVETTVERALQTLGEIPESSLLEPRPVGRAQRPSTVLGLLYHAGEHAQRHTGQVIATAKILRMMSP
jgi:uncharacterized damage-inducible protein DinB